MRNCIKRSLKQISSSPLPVGLRAYTEQNSCGGLLHTHATRLSLPQQLLRFVIVRGNYANCLKIQPHNFALNAAELEGPTKRKSQLECVWLRLTLSRRRMSSSAAPHCSSSSCQPLLRCVIAQFCTWANMHLPIVGAGAGAALPSLLSTPSSGIKLRLTHGKILGRVFAWKNFDTY